MIKYPMKLSPVPKEIIWGGMRLKEHYNKVAPFEKIAESWELCVRENDSAIISSGEYKGLSLKEYVERDSTAVGTDWQGENFPLLIKFIDAESDLSIQVHPDEVYAETHPEAAAKNEVWYILEAEDGAEIVYGFNGEVSRGEFEDAVKSGDIEKTLRRVTVKAGDLFYIPAGQVHAICGGILIAEIQQNSDTTFRIYDYDRVGADGNKRELHVMEALEVVKCYTDEEIENLKYFRRESRRDLLCPSEVLCDCEYFRVTKVGTASEISFAVDERSFVCLLFTDADDAFVMSGEASLEILKGDCVFIPAGMGEVKIRGKSEFLLSEI